MTRTTKIMFGIWGNVPAFDLCFKTALGANSRRSVYTMLNDQALQDVYALYAKPQNRCYLDAARKYTLTFPGNSCRARYPIAKLIDMYGFKHGAHLKGKNVD